MTQKIAPLHGGSRTVPPGHDSCFTAVSYTHLSHGQTVFHAPVEQDYLGYKVRGTLQIGEASMIVEALDVYKRQDLPFR